VPKILDNHTKDQSRAKTTWLPVQTCRLVAEEPSPGGAYNLWEKTRFFQHLRPPSSLQFTPVL